MTRHIHVGVTKPHLHSIAYTGWFCFMRGDFRGGVGTDMAGAYWDWYGRTHPPGQSGAARVKV